MLNVVAIMGRLVADPELRTATQGSMDDFSEIPDSDDLPF